MQHFNRIASKELVIDLPKLKFEKDKVCEACQKGKQTKTSFKQMQFVSTTRPLEMLHMDLFGPSRTMSIGGNYYGLVVVDDFSRYTWTLILVTKDEAFSAYKKLAKIIQNEKNCSLNQFISLLHLISLAPRFIKVFQIAKTIFKGLNF